MEIGLKIFLNARNISTKIIEIYCCAISVYSILSSPSKEEAGCGDQRKTVEVKVSLYLSGKILLPFSMHFSLKEI